MNRQSYFFHFKFYTLYFFLLPYCSSWLPRMTLNRSGENEHPCPVLSLRGRHSLVHLTMTLTIGYYFLSFIRLRKFPSIHTLLEFRCWTWMDAEFCQRLFFKTIEMIIWFFSLVSWYDQSYWLIFESCTSMHSWDKPLLSHDDSFHILRFDLLPFCWEFLHLCSWAILAYSFLFFHFFPLVLLSE